MYNIKRQDKPLDEGPNEGRTVSASSGYTSSWAHKTDFDWDKIGVENCDVDLNDKDFKCKDDTEHRAGSIRRAFKDWLDKVTGLEMELSMGKLVETIKKLPSNRSKCYPKLTIQQLLLLEDAKLLSYKTILKHVERISSLINWAINQGSTNQNVFRGKLEPIRSRQIIEKHFTSDEMNLILGDRLISNS